MVEILRNIFAGYFDFLIKLRYKEHKLELGMLNIMEKVLLFLLQGIPELSGELALSLALAGVSLRWGIIVAAGAALAVLLYIIRLLPFTFGIHSVVAILIMVLLIKIATRVRATTCFIVVFAAFATLAALEFLFSELFFSVFKLDPQSVISNNFLWKLIGMPQAILMIIFALLVSKYKKPREGMWKI
ncbi:MAG: hypothetical protein RJR37_11795 [Peptococcaceae bacterium MAG4]|jgi:hypothetical protein|nr:hypothetical protein [Peptococcaceae bacterium MAG4]